MCGITKKGQESSVKGHSYQFFPLNFTDLGQILILQHVVLRIFTENKLFYFSKRALCVGTTHNKWLKEALVTVSLNDHYDTIISIECYSVTK